MEAITPLAVGTPIRFICPFWYRNVCCDVGISGKIFSIHSDNLHYVVQLNPPPYSLIGFIPDVPFGWVEAIKIEEYDHLRSEMLLPTKENLLGLLSMHFTRSYGFTLVEDMLRYYRRDDTPMLMTQLLFLAHFGHPENLIKIFNLHNNYKDVIQEAVESTLLAFKSSVKLENVPE